jgi:hypothetical protein
MSKRKLIHASPLHHHILDNDLKHEVFRHLKGDSSIITLNLVSKGWNDACKSFNQWFQANTALFLNTINEKCRDSYTTAIYNATTSFQAAMLTLSSNTSVNTNFKNFVGRMMIKTITPWSRIVDLIAKTRLIPMPRLMQHSFNGNGLYELCQGLHAQFSPPFLDATPTTRQYVHLLVWQLDAIWKTLSDYVKRVVTEDSLSLKNYHPRDCHITFFGENNQHYYTVNTINASNGLLYKYYSSGAPLPEEKDSTVSQSIRNKHIYGKIISVTTFISTLYDEFIPKTVIKSLMEGENYEKSQYFGMTPEQIEREWEKRGEYGTKHHHNLENYYQGKEYEKDSIEFGQFLQFEKDHVTGKNLVPYRVEWFIYDLEIGMVGAIDMIYQDMEASKKDGRIHLVMVDYKVVEKLWESNFQGHGGIAPPALHTADCNFMHYSIQQCLYKYILEKNYNVIVDACYLLQLHHKIPKYNLKPVLYHEPFMKELIEYRKMLL